MAKLCLGGSLEVTVTISKREVMDALHELLIRNEKVNADEWTVRDAEELETAARVIRNALVDQITGARGNS